jgi:hypothetical protein
VVFITVGGGCGEIEQWGGVQFLHCAHGENHWGEGWVVFIIVGGMVRLSGSGGED